MADEQSILTNRFRDLQSRGYNRGTYTFSDFLNLHEQTLLAREIKYGYTLFGGYEDAERKIAIFGDEKDLGYSPAPPVSIIKAEPLSQKFSDDLTHRDFLGSLMGLGIKRETLGDIIISENRGYIFCLENMGQYIIDNLIKVRRTSVSCSFAETLPEDALPKPREKVIIIPSLRLDAAISAVYNLSRSKSSALIDGEKVFINSCLAANSSKILSEDDTVSVRGYGRFKIKQALGDTRKGRLRIQCDVY